MRRTKFILLFQAVLTLLIGIAFFSQFMAASQISASDAAPQNIALEEQKIRYSIAAYTLIIVAAIELIIIVRLVS